MQALFSRARTASTPSKSKHMKNQNDKDHPPLPSLSTGATRAHTVDDRLLQDLLPPLLISLHTQQPPARQLPPCPYPAYRISRTHPLVHSDVDDYWKRLGRQRPDTSDTAHIPLCRSLVSARISLSSHHSLARRDRAIGFLPMSPTPPLPPPAPLPFCPLADLTTIICLDPISLGSFFAVNSTSFLVFTDAHGDGCGMWVVLICPLVIREVDPLCQWQRRLALLTADAFSRLLVLKSCRVPSAWQSAALTSTAWVHISTVGGVDISLALIELSVKSTDLS
ncbi:hypothetical protein R3P38DRAFT_3445154 [Favolaschia claudopus]|uniref:Uncharacterized protein n=1 Tax=Favolaschia claudopus TaxID=2862362 RepID=A0AAV9ZQ61_9AGAR